MTDLQDSTPAKKYHFFACTPTDYCKDSNLPTLIDRLRRGVGSKTLQKKAAVWIYRIKLPITAQYDINWFQPVLPKDDFELIEMCKLTEKID